MCWICELPPPVISVGRAQDLLNYEVRQAEGVLGLRFNRVRMSVHGEFLRGDPTAAGHVVWGPYRRSRGHVPLLLAVTTRVHGSEAALQNTIKHELAHAADILIHGAESQYDGHGVNWRRLVRALGGSEAQYWTPESLGMHVGWPDRFTLEDGVIRDLATGLVDRGAGWEHPGEGPTRMPWASVEFPF